MKRFRLNEPVLLKSLKPSCVAFMLVMAIFSVVSHAQWSKTADFPGANFLTSGSLILGDIAGSAVLAGNPGSLRVAHDDNTMILMPEVLGEHTAGLISNLEMVVGTDSGKVFTSRAFDGPWVQRGTAPGRVNALVSWGTRTLLAATNNGVAAMQSSGNTWSGIWEPRNAGLGNLKVASLASFGSLLFAGTDSGVYRSNDSGVHWVGVNTGLSATKVKAFATRGTRLYAGTLGGGVFVTSDSGSSWSSVSQGLKSLAVHALLAVDSNLYAGTDSGVYHSDDYGTNWNSVNAGLAAAPVHALAATGFSPNHLQRIHAAHPEGIWVRPLVQMQPVGVRAARKNNHAPPSVHLEGLRTATLDLSREAHVRIMAHDLSGRRLALLHEAWVPSGAQRIRLAPLPAIRGVVLLRFEVGDVTLDRLVAVER